MATLLIRGLDDTIKKALRIRAAHNGRSMEEEARQILAKELKSDTAQKDIARDPSKS